MSDSTRVGMYGGAFDPPHNAHVTLARAALEQLQLDQLRIFPTGGAWHRAEELTAPEHRLALARIAFGRLPRTVVDDRELRRAGPTYTVETLRELHAERPHAQLFLLMGEDQALSLTRWHEWESILGLATICIARRPDAHAHADQPQSGLPRAARVEYLHLPSMTESATEVRARAARHEDIGHLVPPGVASYIDRHHLYQNN